MVWFSLQLPFLHCHVRLFVSRNVNITPLSPLVFISANGTPIAGQPYTLSCSVALPELSQAPLIEWHDPDDNLIPHTISQEDRALPTTTFTILLQFTSLERSQSGHYTCYTMVNSTLNATTAIDLIVQGMLSLSSASIANRLTTISLLLHTPNNSFCSMYKQTLSFPHDTHTHSPGLDHPGQPEAISGETINSTAILLTLVGPLDNSNIILGYRVTYRRPAFLNGSIQEMVFNASGESIMEMFLIAGLHPGVTYNFSVVAFNDIGDSDPVEHEIATAELGR